MDERKLIDLYNYQMAQSAEKAPKGLWDHIAQKLDDIQLISHYKDELARSEEKAPSDLWNEIVTEMDEVQLISFYKEELDQAAEKAPVDLWDDIERKMDIDEIWDKVAEGLNREKRKGGYWWFSLGMAAAIIMLFVSVWSGWFVGSVISPKAEFAIDEQGRASSIIENEPRESSPTISSYKRFDYDVPLTNRSETRDAIHETTERVNTFLKNEAVADKGVSKFHSGISYSTLASTSYVNNPLSVSSVSLLTTTQPILQKTVFPLLQDERMEINLSQPVNYGGGSLLALGFTSALKNTWLFNHETFQGFNPSSGSRTHLQVYPNVAVSLQYLLAERWRLESSLSFSSSAGQSYEQYMYGQYSQRKITLNYFHAEVLAGYKHRFHGVGLSNAFFHSTSVGFYYGMLNAANESIGGEKVDVSSIYRKNDYGIVAGHNVNIPIWGRLLFAPGLYITWGMPNIYQGEHTLPSLKRTHNRTVEVRFSIHYSIAQ